MSKMRRSCVLPPNEDEAEGGTADLNAHLVQSLLDQARPRTDLALISPSQGAARPGKAPPPQPRNRPSRGPRGLELTRESLAARSLAQAHLCPLPPTELAVYWQHDHALWLHPAPEALILADRTDQYQARAYHPVCPPWLCRRMSRPRRHLSRRLAVRSSRMRRRSPLTPVPSPRTSRGWSTGPLPR